MTPPGPDLPRSRLGEWRFRIARVRAEYQRVHGWMPALFRPRHFTEKMQWRKLFDLNPHFAILSDKLATRRWVEARVGPGRQAPLLWVGDSADAIPFADLTPPYVLKSTHASGQTILVLDGAPLDVAAVREVARGWLAVNFGLPIHEPGYVHVPPRLVVEAMLQGPGGERPAEYRIFVCDGRPVVLYMSRSEGDRMPQSIGFFTPDWVALPWLLPFTQILTPPQPARLAEALDMARCLGAGFDQCRVDLLDCRDGLMIGEITLYSWSGLQPFSDPAHDLALGAMWRLRWPMLRALWALAFRRWEIRPPA